MSKRLWEEGVIGDWRPREKAMTSEPMTNDELTQALCNLFHCVSKLCSDGEPSKSALQYLESAGRLIYRIKDEK